MHVFSIVRDLAFGRDWPERDGGEQPYRKRLWDTDDIWVQGMSC